MFVIAAEGSVTELTYMSLVGAIGSNVRVHCLRKGDKNSPSQVLQRMEQFLKSEGLRTTDEAWVVVDTDAWTAEDLQSLHSWSTERCNHGLAVSNPKFEFWLLLHFDSGNGAATATECDRRLKKHLPAYDKRVEPSKFPRDRIDAAIERARSRDTPACSDWPRNPPGTTVYRLVERVLAVN